MTKRLRRRTQTAMNDRRADTCRWHPGLLLRAGGCSRQPARPLSAQGPKTQTVLHIAMATVPWGMGSPQRAAVGKREQEKSLALASTAAVCPACSASLILKKSQSTDVPPSPILILPTGRGIGSGPLPPTRLYPHAPFSLGVMLQEERCKWLRGCTAGELGGFPL